MASFNSNINNTDSSSPESRFGISGNTGNVNHKRKSSGSLVLVVVLIIGCIGAILVVPFIIAIIAIVIVLSQPSEEIYETRDNENRCPPSKRYPNERDEMPPADIRVFHRSAHPQLSLLCALFA